MESSSDLIEFFKLETRFLDECIEHTRAVPDPARKRRKPIKEVKQWRRVRELGEGGFGVVWLEKDQDGELRAVKEIRKRDQQSNRIDISRELLTIAYFSRDASTFIKFEGWFETDARVFLAMEYLKLGDLQRCVSGPLPEDEASLVTFQLAEGLKTMHSKGFTHLKPTNIFVVSKSPRWWIKIGDFGISKRVREDMTRLQTRMVGDYVAPEILNLLDEDEETSQDYTSAIDMWSLGCVTHWLLTRTTPFPNGKGLLKYCHGRAPFPNDKLSSRVASAETIDFVRSIMATMPSKRLTAEQAIQHPWLASSADTSTSEDESTQTARQPNHESRDEPKETPPLSFDNAKTLVDDQQPFQRLKSVEDPFKNDSSPDTNGLASNCLAEWLNSLKLTIFTETTLIPEDVRNPEPTPASVQVTSQVPLRVFEPGREEDKRSLQVKAPHAMTWAEVTVKEDVDAKLKPQEPTAAGAKGAEARNTSLDPSGARATTEAAGLASFREFAAKEVERRKVKRQLDNKQQKELRLKDIKSFSKEFRLNTPVPKDLLPILAKDVSRQSEIAEQAQRDAQVSTLTYKNWDSAERPGATGPVKASPARKAPPPNPAFELYRRHSPAAQPSHSRAQGHQYITPVEDRALSQTLRALQIVPESASEDL